MKRLGAVLLASLGVLVLAGGASAKVLRVGTYHGIKGQYKTIQAAVSAAKPGDWILIAPGDYKTRSWSSPKGYAQFPSAVLITKKNLTLRGMNRNSVLLDGTKPGSAPCSARTSAQNFGPKDAKGAMGLNGVMVWKADNVAIQNLTACNFLSNTKGDGDTGNEIWWNGGSGSDKVGGWGFTGTYLNATSRYYGADQTAAKYGIFSSNWSGGTWIHTYASNFSDSGYYIGACQQICNQTINDAWGEWSSLGYSGSNSGGRMLIEKSQFDNNKDGFDTNSQNGDNPPPQDGSCPKGVKPPLAGAPTCWVFTKNYVHDNNNPNVPQVGASAAGPVGTGMSISGGRNDTVVNNRFVRNKAWAIIIVPYLDSGPPCTGGSMTTIPGSCLYDDWSEQILGNKFAGNGGYKHPTNVDIAWLNLSGGHPTPCFHGNTEVGGGSVTTSPSNLQATHPKCDGSKIPANNNSQFLLEVLCNSGVEIVSGVPPSCPSGKYPKRTHVTMHPLPTGSLKTMPNPCQGAPANPWCPGNKKRPRHGGTPVSGWAADITALL